jgi:hypothetical protein
VSEERWENRCPECGVDVARVLPCRVCGARCCPCVHAGEWPPVLDADPTERADGERWRASYTDPAAGTVYVEALQVESRVYVAPLGTTPDQGVLAWTPLGEGGV